MAKNCFEYVAGLSSEPSSAAPFDIVFVHGLTGDHRQSWSNAKGEFWPEWLAHEFPSLNIYSAGYQSSATSSLGRGAGPSLADLANILLDHVTSSAPNRPILFIGHSLGGLVVKQMLRKSCDASRARRQAVAKNVLGVIFIATPHTGTQVATAVSAIARLASSRAVRELEHAAAALVDLGTWFSNWAGERALIVESYYETEKYKGSLIVDQVTANPNVPGCDPIAIQADHVEIAKPADKACQLYKSIVAVVRAILSSRPGDGGPAGGSELDPEIEREFSAYTSHAPADRRTLAEKLEHAGRVDEIAWAERQKERFAMTLHRHSAQPSAVRRYTRLMSDIEVRFQRHVKPLLTAKHTASEVDAAVQETVIDPSLRSLDRESVDGTTGLVDSAFYYLAGNCYLSWDNG